MSTAPPIRLPAHGSQPFGPVPVLFEDEHLLALDKPAGLHLLEDPDEPERPSLMGLLYRGIHEGKSWAKARNLAFLRQVHRLDADTSGVLLLAKSRPALEALGNQLNDEKPRRLLVALTYGGAESDEFTARERLAPRPRQPEFMKVDPRRGRKAVTQFRVRERFAGHTLWECRPLTERLHQIRLHLRYHRLAVVSDPAYGGRPLLLSDLKRGYRFKAGAPEKPLIARPAVHSEALEIEHPVSGEPLRIVAPLPKDFQVALKYLRKFAPPSPPLPDGAAASEFAPI